MDEWVSRCVRAWVGKWVSERVWVWGHTWVDESTRWCEMRQHTMCIQSKEGRRDRQSQRNLQKNNRRWHSHEWTKMRIRYLGTMQVSQTKHACKWWNQTHTSNHRGTSISDDSYCDCFCSCLFCWRKGVNGRIDGEHNNRLRGTGDTPSVGLVGEQTIIKINKHCY